MENAKCRVCDPSVVPAFREGLFEKGSEKTNLLIGPNLTPDPELNPNS